MRLNPKWLPSGLFSALFPVWSKSWCALSSALFGVYLGSSHGQGTESRAERSCRISKRAITVLLWLYFVIYSDKTTQTVPTWMSSCDVRIVKMCLLELKLKLVGFVLGSEASGACLVFLMMFWFWFCIHSDWSSCLIPVLSCLQSSSFILLPACPFCEVSCTLVFILKEDASCTCRYKSDHLWGLGQQRGRRDEKNPPDHSELQLHRHGIYIAL